MKKAPMCDSREGMEMMMAWARAGRLVLNGAHERLARKHGVSTEGVIFARPIP